MQPELIRCSLSKKSSSKEKQTTENESYTPTSNILKRFEDESQLREFPIMNLLQSDTSTSLYSTQWTLISNLIYCYDESRLLSLGRQIANENQDTQVSTSLSSQFFMEVYKTAEKYLRSNQNLYRLSTDDRASFIHIAAESITWTGAIFTWKQCQLSNCSSFITDFKNTYGDNLLNSIERVLKYMEIDLVIFKLGLSLFTFCNNLLLFPSMTVVKPESIRAVFHIQSTSAEVTWKYLLYKYGAQQSVRRFMNLIQSFLLTMETIHDAQNSPEHVNDIETIVEKVELALILDDIEHIDDNKNDL
ncbi:hypothetical protein I4U23_012061 [Adineta vaga]|nr:hypothetical protein I4U23_012061 [Adineta vaga]